MFVVGASAQLNWDCNAFPWIPACANNRAAVLPTVYRWDCNVYPWVPPPLCKIGTGAGFTVEVPSASEVKVEEHNCRSREVWRTEKKVWCCKEKGINCPLTPKPVPALVGSNACTYGPSYWCASEANAQECQFDFGQCENGGLKKDDAEKAIPFGRNPCTRGPSYWCASKANAQECQFDFGRCENAEGPIFNCKSRDVWTNEKAQWCCKNENTGCFYATLERGEVQDRNADADASCANGILSDDGAVCCASTCGTCGGKGCAKRAWGSSSSACCKQTILAKNMLCARKQAPCVMDGAGYSVDPEDEVKRGARN